MFNTKKNFIARISLTLLLAAVLLFPFNGQATAQAPVLVRRAELSVPFGTISGKLVLVGDQLVFVDEDKLEDSFAIARNEIKDFKAENEVVMIETRRPIRDRSGERANFSFRLREGSSEALTMWAGSKQTGTTAQVEEWTYNVKHPHSIARVPSGSCTGKLIITRDRVVFESLEEREHTRQWPLIDIKKVKRSSPYRFEVEPFNNDKYTLELEGGGMDISVFKKLQNWVALARQRS